MISYTYQITARDEAAKTVTVVYDPDPPTLPNVTSTLQVVDMAPQTISIAVAKNAPFAYWAEIDPSVLPPPAAQVPFSVDPTKPPPSL